MQVGDDRRQCRRDDRLVERREEHPEHQGADDDEHTAVAEDRDRGVHGQMGRFGHYRRPRSLPAGRRVPACCTAFRSPGSVSPADIMFPSPGRCRKRNSSSGNTNF